MLPEDTANLKKPKGAKLQNAQQAGGCTRRAGARVPNLRTKRSECMAKEPFLDIQALVACLWVKGKRDGAAFLHT
jgi:hypothetical protein